MAIAIIIDKGAPGIPALQAGSSPRSYAGLGCYFGERAVAVVVIECAIPPVRDEQVIVAIVVIVSRAHALAPAGAQQTGFRRHIRKGSVAIILIKPVRRLGAASVFRLETRAVHKEYVQPAVVVVIEERGSAARSFE